MAVEKQELDSLRSVEELLSYQKVVREGIRAIDTEFKGLRLPQDQRAEFAALVEIDKDIHSRVEELEGRQRMIAQLGEDPKKRERAFGERTREFESETRDVSRFKERDLFDVDNLRSQIDWVNPERAREQLTDKAKRAIELTRFPQLQGMRRSARSDGYANLEEGRIRSHLEYLLESTQEGDPESPKPGEVALHLLKTGGPVYRRAFWKSAIGAPISPEEMRALSLTGSGGGFAIPFALDPSIIPTSNSVVNPARALARLVTIAGANTWQGVTSPAVVATRVAEATEATDNATTLVQPQATVSKGQLLIPFSIEVGEDWPQLEAEFGRLAQDAKDDEEGVGFVTGNGTAPNPQGFVTGSSTTFAAATGLTVTAANMYGLEAALPPRFRPRESFVANRGIYNVVRGIDTAGGAALWLYMAQGLVTQAPTPGNTGATLLGRGAWEASGMQASVVNATKIMVVGDFTYFLIVDRIGMTVELVPHIFGSVSKFPIGQRGLYAYYRNTSKVLSASAFVAMTGTT